VTRAETHEGVGLGVHVVYPTLSYNVDRMVDYFSSFAAIWRACSRLVHDLYHDDIPYIVDTTRPAIPQPQTRDRSAVLAQLSQLRVHRLSIQSPMEITFAVEGGIAAVALYTTALFARVLRHPEQIGAWLPRLVAGWHRGMREADKERDKRRLRIERMAQPSPEMQEVITASYRLLQFGMKASEVATIGTDALPDDLAESDTS
jgi:hypothetical protein